MKSKATRSKATKSTLCTVHHKPLKLHHITARFNTFLEDVTAIDTPLRQLEPPVPQTPLAKAKRFLLEAESIDYRTSRVFEPPKTNIPVCAKCHRDYFIEINKHHQIIAYHCLCGNSVRL